MTLFMNYLWWWNSEVSVHPVPQVPLVILQFWEKQAGEHISVTYSMNDDKYHSGESLSRNVDLWNKGGGTDIYLVLV